ncbi:MAG: hypothetical protein V5A44_02710 [Haloarculaceae archaeon]
MADTKDGREKQARNADRRQREREVAEARARADEVEPAEGEQAVVDADQTDERDLSDVSLRCHRRSCEELAEFVVLERYQEDTGHGAVEAEALLCRDHTDKEGPANLDGVYDGYVFRVDPIVANPDVDTA